MPGFGDSPFGTGPFGSFDWAGYQLIDLVPEIYLSQDDDYGGVLQALLRSLTSPIEYISGKIETLHELRDPLLVPTESSFGRDVIIIQVDNLGDGTSRVFISKGSDGLGFSGARVGYVLRDAAGSEFEILEVNTSELPGDFDSPPVDPYSGNPTGANVIVLNSASGLQDVIPQVSGAAITENPVPTPVDDGINRGPYVFTVAQAPLAANTVVLSWTEGGSSRTGYIVKDGRYSGQLTVGTSINYVTGVVSVSPLSGAAIDHDSLRIAYTTQRVYSETAQSTPVNDGVHTGPYSVTAKYPPLAATSVNVNWTEYGVAKSGAFSGAGSPSGSLTGGSTINFTTGVMSINNTSGVAIDAGSLKISYLSATIIPPVDATIRSQNLISFLGGDYGVVIDRNDPEVFQRSQLYNAFQLWDIKGTRLAFEVMGGLSGFDVTVLDLSKVSSGLASTIGSDHVFVFQGDLVTQENPGHDDPTGFVYPPEDGTAVSFSIHTELGAIYQESDIQISWTEGGATHSAILTKLNLITGVDAGSLLSWTADRTQGSMSVVFANGHAPDVDSVRLTYYRPARYTDLSANTLVMDDVAMDAIPLDMYCFYSDYPTVVQSVTVSAVQVITVEALGTVYGVTVTTTASHESFGTEGLLKDAANNQFSVADFEWKSSSSYYFTTFSAVAPTTGSGTVTWNVLKDVGDFTTENPGTTSGSTISPAEDGSTLGAFTIGLARHPLWTSPSLTITWSESAVAKTATLSSTSTVSGTNAANISSASINRTTGVLTITFAGGHPPDADSIRVTYSPIGDLAIAGVGTDVVSIGLQNVQYTGIRYRLTSTFPGPIVLGSVGSWKIIDAAGVQSWLESCKLISTTPYTYEFEFIASQAPVVGPANIFYVCELVPSCQFCAASAIHVDITPDQILNYPEVSVTDAASRLIQRMSQVIPVHVRIADFSVDGAEGDGNVYVFGGKSHGSPYAPGEVWNSITRWNYTSATATTLTNVLTDQSWGGASFGNLVHGIIVGGLFAGVQYIDVFNYANETALAGPVMPSVSSDYVSTAGSNSTTGFVMIEPGFNPAMEKYNYAPGTWSASGSNAFWFADGFYGWTRPIGNETVSLFGGANGVYKYSFASDSALVIGYAADQLFSWVQQTYSGSASNANLGVFVGQGHYHDLNLSYEFANDATYPLRASLGFASGQPRPRHRFYGAGNADIAAFFGGDSLVEAATGLYPNTDTDNFLNTIVHYSYEDKTLTEVGFLPTKLGYMTALATRPGGLLSPKHAQMTASEQGVSFVDQHSATWATGAVPAGTFSMPITNINVNNPLRSGDFMLATIVFDTNGSGLASAASVTIPAGWTLVKRADLGNQSLITMYKFASATEPANYTITHTIPTAGSLDTWVRTYSNVSPSSPITDVQVAGGASLTSMNSPSVNVHSPYDRAIIAMVHNDATYPLGYTYPHNLFPREYTGRGAGYYPVYFEDLAFSAGPSTPQPFTFASPGASVIMQVISLRRGPV